MTARFWAEPLRFTGANRGGMSALSIICWAQILMVVANLGRIPLVSTGDRNVPVTLNELCLGAILATAMLAALSARALRLDRVALTVLAFVVIGGGSAIWSVFRFDLTAFELLVALSYLARWVLYFGIYIAVTNVVREGGVEKLWLALETMLIIFAVFGIMQSAFLPNFAQTVYPESREYIDWDPQGHRLVSTVLEPNIAAAMLMIGLLVQLARTSVGAPVGRWRILVVFVALTLTLSRSGALGFVAGLIVLIAARGLSRRVVRMAIVAGGLGLAFSPLLIQYAVAYSKFTFGLGSSAGARVVSWLMTLRVIADFPIFGVGFNAYKFAVRHYGSEQIGASSYAADGGLLFIMAMTGIIGLLVYCVMLGQILARCRSIWRDGTVVPAQRGLAIGAAAATVGVVVQSAFVNAILTTMVMEMLWILWGITFVIARARDARTASHGGAIPSRVVAPAA